MDKTADTLVICASFFGYAQEIKDSLERRGRHVALFEDRPATDSMTKALIRVAPALMRAKADAYFDDIAAAMQGQPIRDVLVIKGEALSPAAVRRMRQDFPDARFTLYFWDSYRNMPRDSAEKVALFDRALSFDPEDVAKDPRLAYRPLFYVERHARLPDVKQDIDILFFGTIHGDRYAVVKRLEASLAPGMRFEKVLYIRAPWLYTLGKIFDRSMWKARRGEFVFAPKSRAELAQLTARAHIVLDIERPIQSGLTMRTVEMLGAGRKLVTTNAAALQADFYDPSNIAVIDRRAPRLTDAFLKAAYRAPSKTLLYRYSLEGWLDDVLPEHR